MVFLQPSIVFLVFGLFQLVTSTTIGVDFKFKTGEVYSATGDYVISEGHFFYIHELNVKLDAIKDSTGNKLNIDTRKKFVEKLNTEYKIFWQGGNGYKAYMSQDEMVGKDALKLNPSQELSSILEKGEVNFYTPGTVPLKEIKD